MFNPQQLLGHRLDKGKSEYLVRWAGYTPDDDTWEPVDNLANSGVAIDAYWRKATSSKSNNKSEEGATPRAAAAAAAAEPAAPAASTPKVSGGAKKSTPKPSGGVKKKTARKTKLATPKRG